MKHDIAYELVTNHLYEWVTYQGRSYFVQEDDCEDGIITYLLVEDGAGPYNWSYAISGRVIDRDSETNEIIAIEIIDVSQPEEAAR